MAKKKKKTPKFRLEMGWGGVLVVITGAFAAILWTFVLGVWVGKKVAGPKEELKLAALETTVPRETKGEAPLFNMESRSPFEEKTGERQSPKAPPTEYGKKGAGISSAPLTTKAITEKTTIQEEVISEGPKKATTNETRPSATQGHKMVKVEEARPRPVQKPPKKLSKSRPRPYFALQVASFRDLKYAQKEVIRWENLGYSATIKKVNLGPKKGTWYRVFVGRFNTIAEARKGAVELAKKFKQKSYIRPVR